MIEILTALIISASCPETIMINKTEYPWNSHDYRIREVSRKSCRRIYGEKSCLVKFVKTGVQSYQGICN